MCVLWVYLLEVPFNVTHVTLLIAYVICNFLFVVGMHSLGDYKVKYPFHYRPKHTNLLLLLLKPFLSSGAIAVVVWWLVPFVLVSVYCIYSQILHFHS